MTELRAGLIGLGMMGKNHARVLQQTDGIELVGVVDPQGDRFGAARGVTILERLDQLLELEIDICVVSAPTAEHEAIGLRLAEAGVHTMVEKPIAGTVEEAVKLVEAFQSRGLIGAVGHIERFNPALQQLQRRLEAGELGDIYQLTTRRVGPFPGRIHDVGVIKDLATHDIDLTAWVAGSSFVSISAQTAHKSGREHEDLVAATGRLADGTVTNHLVNWLSPMKERLTVVTGERGSIAADTLTADLTFHANGVVETGWDAISRFRGVSEGDMIRYAFAKAEPLATEHQAFRDAVLTGDTTSIVSMREGLETLAVAEDMLRSAEENRSVEISPPAASS